MRDLEAIHRYIDNNEKTVTKTPAITIPADPQEIKMIPVKRMKPKMLNISELYAMISVIKKTIPRPSQLFILKTRLLRLNQGVKFSNAMEMPLNELMKIIEKVF